MLSCRDKSRAFVVINADDFYGRSSFEALYNYLVSLEEEKPYYAMAGFILKNTLTEHGHVASGVCKVNSQGYLEEIREHTKIMKFRFSKV